MQVQEIPMSYPFWQILDYNDPTLCPIISLLIVSPCGLILGLATLMFVVMVLPRAGPGQRRTSYSVVGKNVRKRSPFPHLIWEKSPNTFHKCVFQDVGHIL